jgi:hypothetical protein
LVLSAYLGLPTTSKQYSPPAQTTPPQYFPETQRTVRSPFVEYFAQNGGLAQFGYPITDDYVDSATGLLIQYFEKARMEWHPGNPEPYKVQLGLLGDEMGKRKPPVSVADIPAPNDPDCVHFEATGHTLCTLFRDYYSANGGLDRFGYPIDEYTIENGFLVQYFQRARMEYHPERPIGQRVQLAPLGLIYYRYARLDESRLYSGTGSTSYDAIDAARVATVAARASVFNPVIVAKGQQTVFVYVTDHLGTPLGNAGVTLVVHYPDLDRTFQLPPTSASGTSFQTFVVPEVGAGTVIAMDFIVTHNGLFGSTKTSYMVWH